MHRDQERAASLQGWGVFTTRHEEMDHDVREIQRLDLPAQAAEDFGLGWDAAPDEPVFDSDAEAERHVRALAKQGDAVALAALEETTYSHLHDGAGY